MRGHLIQLASKCKRERLLHITRLERELDEATTLLQSNPSRDLRARVTRIRTDLDVCLTDQTERHLRWTGQKFYANNNKIGSMLANKLRVTGPRYRTLSLKTRFHRCTANLIKILDEFQFHLSKLYSRSGDYDVSDMNKFLTDSSLSSLTAEQRETLDLPITESEVRLAIKETKSHKRPGPDGFSALFYKRLPDVVAHPLAVMFNSLRHVSQLSSDILKAHIVMILKPDTDMRTWANYRPISLLNSDLKLLTKILASRLNKYIHTLIHKDQVGFVPLRQAADNVRKTILLNYYARHRSQQMMLLSLDIRKAFDTLSWSFLRAALLHRGLGVGFLSWFDSLYSVPPASVKYMGYESLTFSIRRGTRQGCPLSPLLFILALEPLAAHIRANPNIKGLELAGVTHKLAMFADDMLLYVSSLLISLPNLLSLINRFAAFSGLCINPVKSKALNVTLPTSEYESIRTQFPFQWPAALPYLGIFLTSSYDSLYAANYPPLIASLRRMLGLWDLPNISWLGRIHAVKMTFFLKLLYPFRVLPIKVPPHVLRILQRLILTFIWKGGRPRLRKSLLYSPKTSGGLGVPNLATYYKAAQIVTLTHLHATGILPVWALIDVMDTDPIPLSSIHWLPPAQRPKMLNPVLAYTLFIWDSIKYSANLISPHLPLLSWLNCPMFPPGLESQSFDWWKQRNLTSVHSRLTLRGICSFQSLRDSRDIPERERFHYIQIHHFIASLLKQQPHPIFPTAFEIRCRSNLTTNGLISLLYSSILNNVSSGPPPYCVQWETDLSPTIQPGDWNNIWRSMFKSSINVLALENSYKVMSRWYYTPARIAKFCPSYPSNCFHGCR